LPRRLVDSGWEVGPLRHTWVFLLVALALAAVAAAVNRYYDEVYGRLTPSTRQQLRAGIAVVVAVALTLGGATLLRSHASWSLDLPVNPIAVCFALVMLLSYAIGVGLKAHHVIIWGGRARMDYSKWPVGYRMRFLPSEQRERQP
jgi:4-hydroxybenzoate polyprenyltransferase